MPFSHEPNPRVVTISTLTFVKVALLVVAAWLVWYFRDIIAIVVAALVLAALIDPFASALAKRRVPRAISILFIYLFVACLGFLVFVQLIPVVVEQSESLLNVLAGHTGVSRALVPFQASWTASDIVNGMRSALQEWQSSIFSSLSSVFSTVKGVVGGIATVFITFALTFYLVSEERAAEKFFKMFLPDEYQPFANNVLVKIQQRMGGWLRGQILVGVVVGAAVYLGLRLIGVEYALLLAVLAAIMEVVPYIGPVVSLIPALLLGFAQGPIQGLLVLALYIIVQQLENHILVPKLMQKATGLHPAVIIIALLIGAKAAGVMGAILSIPIATMVAVVLEEIYHE